MKHNNTFQKIIQEVISEKEVENITKMYGFEDTGRKLTVYNNFKYFLGGAILKVKSYRELAFLPEILGLPKVNYSTFSKKAAAIPYKIYEEICKRVLSRLNREKRRVLNNSFDRVLSVIDSTRIIEKNDRFQWALYKEGASGVKFHVSFRPDTGMPTMAVPTEINVGDSTMLEKHCDREACILADRGYLNVKKLCQMDETGQEFAIRIRNTVRLKNAVPFPALQGENCEKYTDVLCTLCNDRDIPACCRRHQFRVVSFFDDKGKEVRICTNITDLSAKEIADLYRLRWTIEVFFKTLKQNFAIKRMFGTSRNAVFSQGLIAIIAYAVLFDCYSAEKIFADKSGKKYVFLEFLRSLIFECFGGIFNVV